MTDRKEWPTDGLRPLRPEDNDPDKLIRVSVPPQVISARQQQPEIEETGRFRRWLHRIGRIFVRP
jgi:hypothetical protein